MSLCALSVRTRVYDINDYGGSSTWSCDECEVGWKSVWKDWLEKKLGRSSYCNKCLDHDYEGSERPTVLCDACWKIWFEAPDKSKHLIQNVDKEDNK